MNRGSSDITGIGPPIVDFRLSMLRVIDKMTLELAERTKPDFAWQGFRRIINLSGSLDELEKVLDSCILLGSIEVAELTDHHGYLIRRFDRSLNDRFKNTENDSEHT